MKVNVVKIDSTWSSCPYKFRVFVADTYNHKYVKETLQKWFGSAVYLWDNCYLCGTK